MTEKKEGMNLTILLQSTRLLLAEYFTPLKMIKQKYYKKKLIKKKIKCKYRERNTWVDAETCHKLRKTIRLIIKPSKK